jgi:aspartate aminotransferase
MGILQGQSTSNVCTFAQYGAIAALTSPQDCVEHMRRAFAERRAFIFDRVNRIAGLKATQPNGAFYLYVDIESLHLPSVEFCEILLKEQQVAMIPGKAFGKDGTVRISYATDMATIEEGMNRLETFVKSRL